MSAKLPCPRLLVTLVALLGSGCTHYANVTTQPAADGSGHVVASSRTARDGSLHTVREHVLPAAGRCDRIVLEREHFTPDGGLRERTIEHRRCGVVELRVVDHFDGIAATHTRTVQRDVDHDGQFDSERVEARDLAGVELAARR
jgi:hypothetical protein